MTATGPLTLYADLYRDFPECVPEGWTVEHIDATEGNPWSGMNLRCNGCNIMEPAFDGHQPTVMPWFLDLARQTVENRLEAEGIHIVCTDCGWNMVRWSGGQLTRNTETYFCPHAAACAAYRAMKEQP